GEYARLLPVGDISGGDIAGLAGARARDAKHVLARAIVTWLYSGADADAAAEHFARVTVEREDPEEVVEAEIDGVDGVVHLPAVIEREFGMSRSQARRLIDEGGVALGGETLTRGEHDVE